jgi:hypothetical protein
MNCHELAQHIERLQPSATAQDVARLCLLLSNAVGSVDVLADHRRLAQAWQETGLRLQAATDQHAAMTEELEALAGLPPADFGQREIWTLIRAIKVQSQILQMYVGQPLLEA